MKLHVSYQDSTSTTAKEMKRPAVPKGARPVLVIVLALLVAGAGPGCGLGGSSGDETIDHSEQGATPGRIRPCPANKFYWEYDGRCQLLFGGSNRDNLFQWADEGTRLKQHLDLLVQSGGNYVRNTMSSREYTPGGYRWDLLPYPWKRLGSGKYDLDQWDTQYWSRLQKLLDMTQQRGIVVQVELWDMWNESGDSNKNSGG